MKNVSKRLKRYTAIRTSFGQTTRRWEEALERDANCREIRGHS